MTFAAVGTFVSAYGGAIAAAAAAVGAVGAIAAGSAQKKAADYNATIADQRAESLRQQGATNEDAQRRRADLALGKQAAATADSTGLSGTGVDVFEQSATDAELDALNIRYGAQTGVLSADDQADLDRQQGRNALTGGYLNAGANALSTVGTYLQTGRITGGGGRS